MSKIHELKILPAYFDAVLNGKKTFEFRFDDRGYAVDDTLVLHEWEYGAYTGRCISARVTYLLKNFDGLKNGWVILAIKPFYACLERC